MRYTLAVAVLKGDATDEVIRDAVMMGVARIRPFVATRSAGAAGDARPRTPEHARWARVAVASAKQSGRAVVPAIDHAGRGVRRDRRFSGSDDPSASLLVEPAVSTAAVARWAGAARGRRAVTLSDRS